MPAVSYAGHFFHMAPPANACDPESCASILAWCVKKLSAAQLEKKSSKDESGKPIIGPTMILSKETLALKPDCISESIDVDIYYLAPNMEMKDLQGGTAEQIQECLRLVFAWEGPSKRQKEGKDEESAKKKFKDLLIKHLTT